MKQATNPLTPTPNPQACGRQARRQPHRQPYRLASPWAAALGVVLLALGTASSAARSATPVPRAQAAARPCPAPLQHTQARLQDEKPVDLCGYAGQVVLVVNTASFCGYTSQYESLEALYKRLRGQGLVVLGFPSNDFGQQEPGSNAEIASFCENTFGVQFPMFAKSHVAPGPGRTSVNPVFAQLAQRTGSAPRWNFHKYLISRDGRTVLSHGSAVSPEDPKFMMDLERLLKAN